jgi:hypothetical protein
MEKGFLSAPLKEKKKKIGWVSHGSKPQDNLLKYFLKTVSFLKVPNLFCTLVA